MRIIVLTAGRCRFLEENESGFRFRRNKIWQFTEYTTPIIDPLEQLQMSSLHVNQVTEVADAVHKLEEKYPDLWKSDLEQVKRLNAKINVPKSTTPKFLKPHPVPYAIRVLDNLPAQHPCIPGNFWTVLGAVSTLIMPNPYLATT